MSALILTVVHCSVLGGELLCVIAVFICIIPFDKRRQLMRKNVEQRLEEVSWGGNVVVFLTRSAGFEEDWLGLQHPQYGYIVEILQSYLLKTFSIWWEFIIAHYFLAFSLVYKSYSFIESPSLLGVGERGVINGSHCQYKYKILLVDQAPGKL